MPCMAWNPQGKLDAGTLVSMEFELQLRLTLTSLLKAPNRERNLGAVRVVLMEEDIFEVRFYSCISYATRPLSSCAFN